MLILSNGMPKSGSTLLSWFQKDMLMQLVSDNGQKKLELSILSKQISGIGHFVDNIESKNKLSTLIDMSETHGSFLVKCHAAITEDVKDAIRNKKVVVSFTHRDPRDIVLSAIDHGKREVNKSRFFAQFQSIEQAIPFVIEQCKIALEWIDSGLVEVFRYQDIISNPHNEILRFCKMINQKASKKLIDKLVKTYTDSPITGVRQYNTGKLLRYKYEMTLEEIELCNKALSYYILKLGYQL